MDLQSKQKTQLEIKAEEKQEFKFIGSTKKIPGLKLYSFNYKTGELKESCVKKDVIINLINGGANYKTKATFNPDCIYFQSLNFNKAVRKANIIIKEKTGIADYFKIENGKILRKVVK